jgi:hypothetical protein
METALRVDPNEVRATASRWQMIGADLGTGGVPPVGLATSWPSAAGRGPKPLSSWENISR